MHSSTLILLAVSVFSHLATAAVIRHGSFARSGIFIRSFNQSTIAVAPEQQPPHSTSHSLVVAPSTLATSTPSAEASSLPLPQAAAVSSVLPSKQVGSVPAVGNGPGAASIESSATTTSSAALPSSTISRPSPTAALSSTDGGPSIAATTKQVGSVPAAGNGPGAASIESSATTTSSTKSLLSVVLPSSTTSKPSLATASSSSTAGRASESPLTTKTSNSSTTSTSFSRLFTLNTGVGSESAPPSASETPQGQSSSPSPAAQPSGVLASPSNVASVSSPSQSLTPTITDIPSSTNPPGKDGNIQAANQFNSYFDAMNPNSGCDATLNSEATACINKQLARCGSDRKYSLTSCPEGQECRALPLDNGSRGIYIQCITPSEAAAKLSPGQSSSVPIAATPSSSSLESVTQKITVQGPSTTAAQGSVTPSSQTGKPSSETGPSTGPLSLPTIIITSGAKPTFSFGPTTTETKSSSSSSLAVASPTPNNAGSPSSTIPSATADSTTESPLVISVPTTLLTTARPSKTPVPTSKASTAPSAQTSASDLSSESEPGISIIPVPRITDNPTKPTSTAALPVVVNAAGERATTSSSFTAGSRVTVTETVTVTTTVHDQ